MNSSVIAVWALMSPVGTLIASRNPHSAPRWFLAYFVLIAASALLQPRLRSSNNLPPQVILLLLVLNIGGISGLVSAIIYYFVYQKDIFLDMLRLEQQKSEELLLNILPKEIASRLKNEEPLLISTAKSASCLRIS